MWRRFWLILVLFSTSTLLSGRYNFVFAQNSSQKEVKKEATKIEVGAVPTPQHIVELMLTLADVKESDLVYDLGCGDGRIVVTAAQKYGCKAVGFDIDADCVRESLANVANANVEALVTIEESDIFEVDLSKADVVTLYLLARLNERLIPQLEKMKPGSRIVSHDYGILGVEPDIEVDCNSRVHGMRDRIYLWTTPLNRVEVSETLAERSPLEVTKTYFLERTSQRVLASLVILTLVGASLVWLLQKLLRLRLILTVEKSRTK